MSLSLKKNRNISPHRNRLDILKNQLKEIDDDEKKELLLSLLERMDEMENSLEEKNIQIENLYSEISVLRYNLEKIQEKIQEKAQEKIQEKAQEKINMEDT